MIPVKHFYMIRHGQTVANLHELMAGSLDSPLTELGIEQAINAREVVASLAVKPVAIFHSDLSRARDTAEIINQGLNVPTFEDPDLAEIHVGELEGVPYEDCKHILNGWDTTPGGESAEEFFERIKQAKMRALNYTDEGPVLTVCHGGVMRAFGELYGISPEPMFKNAQIHEFTPHSGSHFPWRVHEYERNQGTGIISRFASSAYVGNASAPGAETMPA